MLKKSCILSYWKKKKPQAPTNTPIFYVESYLEYESYKLTDQDGRGVGGGGGVALNVLSKDVSSADIMKLILNSM